MKRLSRRDAIKLIGLGSLTIAQSRALAGLLPSFTAGDDSSNEIWLQLNAGLLRKRLVTAGFKPDEAATLASALLKKEVFHALEKSISEDQDAGGRRVLHLDMNRLHSRLAEASVLQGVRDQLGDAALRRAAAMIQGADAGTRAESDFRAGPIHGIIASKPHSAVTLAEALTTQRLMRMGLTADESTGILRHLSSNDLESILAGVDIHAGAGLKMDWGPLGVLLAAGLVVLGLMGIFYITDSSEDRPDSFEPILLGVGIALAVVLVIFAIGWVARVGE